MKKKYQIPESRNRFLRTSLVVCSGNTPGQDVTVDVKPSGPDGPEEGEARPRKTNLSLLDC